MRKNGDNSSPNKKIRLGKIIAKTALKTFVWMVFILGFVVISASVVAPKFALRAFDAAGMDDAAYVVQKRYYNRDSSLENLYELIQRAIEQEKYSDLSTLIYKMIEDDDYTKFCQKVDKATKQVLGERYSIYADSYDNYLRRHLVIALYNSDRELEAKMMAIDSVYGSLNELSVYVDLIVNDQNLTDFQKETEMTTLYSRYSIVSALETKLHELDELLNLSDSTYDSVIVYEQKIKLSNIQIALGEYAGDATLKQTAKDNKELWTSQLTAEIEKLK